MEGAPEGGARGSSWSVGARGGGVAVGARWRGVSDRWVKSVRDPLLLAPPGGSLAGGASGWVGPLAARALSGWGGGDALRYII